MYQQFYFDCYGLKIFYMQEKILGADKSEYVDPFISIQTPEED